MKKRKVIKKTSTKSVRKSNKSSSPLLRVLILLFILGTIVLFASRINLKNTQMKSNIKSPTSTSVPSPTLSPTPTLIPFTPTPTPDLTITIGEITSRCITLSAGDSACGEGNFKSASESGVNYVVYNIGNGGCGRFDLPVGVVAYDGGYLHYLAFGPRKTIFDCTLNFYTTAGYNYLKSLGKLPEQAESTPIPSYFP
ncbi:MAG TPA: hypothetical protein VHE53_03655 [Patescibacteria group bacterium]|nr:hypothetical protein [Patescibacteria group bacterium]